MTSSYPITGIPLPTAPDPTHPIPVRQEIDAWYSNPDNAIQVSLFIQALEKFMKTDYREMLSYYQVAGLLRDMMSRYLCISRMVVDSD